MTRRLWRAETAFQVSAVWNAKDELPIEIELGGDCRYHSVFACPILRQQTADTNPPMKLVCGHVISKAKQSDHVVPSCPWELQSIDMNETPATDHPTVP